MKKYQESMLEICFFTLGRIHWGVGLGRGKGGLPRRYLDDVVTDLGLMIWVRF
jgi:hypothetical protein